MTLQEIKNAIAAGKRVCWMNHDYVVTIDRYNQYLIYYLPNGNCIGLTHQDGVTLNGNESDFYIKSN